MFDHLDKAILENLVLSGVLVAVGLGLRSVIEWGALRSASGVDKRRRRFAIRSVGNILLALALLALWMSQIQTVIFSLAAVMVALVVATKELIMCAAGAILRVGGHLFRVGDRIEVAGLHGEVIDHGLFSTTVMELPPIGEGASGTGRTLMLPNSVFLTGPVRVEAQPRQYAPHHFAITLEASVPVAEAIRTLEGLVDKATEEDRERAIRFHRLTTHKLGAEIGGPKGHVTVTTSDIGKLCFHVMIYCLVQHAADIQKAVTIAFLDSLSKPASKAAPSSWETQARELVATDRASERPRRAA